MIEVRRIYKDVSLPNNIRRFIGNHQKQIIKDQVIISMQVLLSYVQNNALQWNPSALISGILRVDGCGCRHPPFFSVINLKNCSNRSRENQ